MQIELTDAEAEALHAITVGYRMSANAEDKVFRLACDVLRKIDEARAGNSDKAHAEEPL